jgi:hypothetical protein
MLMAANRDDGAVIEEADVAKPTSGDWDELTRDLSTRVAAFAPEWSEPSGGDPGITLVELFGFLTESLLPLGEGSPDVRARLDEIVARLQRADGSLCRDGTLTRPHYFFGKLMSVDDFNQEQSYQRTKHRRHNRLVHGHGIVRGLGVSVEPQQPGQAPRVTVGPGVAIDPTGEELVVCDAVTRDVSVAGTRGYVTVSLVELPVDRTPEGEHLRVDEAADVSVVEDVPNGHLAIARLRHVDAGWRTDPSFRPARVR